jgi:hypothetical protein
MIASDRARVRLARCIVATFALGVGAACGDFPRTNPLDPGARLDLVLEGPDSVTSVGDTVSFQVRSADGEDLTPFVTWRTPAFLTQVTGEGRFVVLGSQGFARIAGTLTAVLGASEVSRPFTWAQQPFSLRVDDCTNQKLLTFTALMIPNDTWSDSKQVCATAFDRRGFTVPTDSIITATFRDPDVARFVTADQHFVNAQSVGSTFLVYSGVGLADSIRIDVRQDAAAIAVDPPECSSLPGLQLSVNQSIDLTARAPVTDLHGNVITDPVAVQAALASIQWAPSYDVQATVTQSGRVTAVAAGGGYIFGYLGAADALRIVLACRIVIQ